MAHYVHLKGTILIKCVSRNFKFSEVGKSRSGWSYTGKSSIPCPRLAHKSDSLCHPLFLSGSALFFSDSWMIILNRNKTSWHWNLYSIDNYGVTLLVSDLRGRSVRIFKRLIIWFSFKEFVFIKSIIDRIV